MKPSPTPECALELKIRRHRSEQEEGPEIWGTTPAAAFDPAVLPIDQGGTMLIRHSRLLATLCLGSAVALAAPLAAADTLEVVGTGDGVKILEALGRAFTEANPGVTMTVPPSIGSSGGIKAVGTSRNIVGRVARPIKDKEKPYGLEYLPFARIPVAFFVNPGVSVRGLTAGQLTGIFAGQLTEWSQVGAKSGRIRVVRREDGDSSLSTLRKSFPDFGPLRFTEHAKTVTRTPEAFRTVATTPGAIGFGPYDVALDAAVKVLQVDGRDPGDAGYPSFTTLALVYKKADCKGDLKVFLDFVNSPAAAPVIRRAGGVPIR